LSKRHFKPPQHNLDEASGRSENRPSGPVKVVIESLPSPPSPSEEEKAEKKQDKRFKWGKAILEVLAFLGLVVYVRETRRTNNLTQAAIQDARDNFIKDQQPIIWVTPKNPTFGVNQKLQWNIEFSNYGRSPALNMRTCIHPSLGSSAFSAAQQHPPSLADCRGQVGSVTVVPPSYPGFATAYFDDLLTGPDVNAIEQISGGLVVVGAFEYEDISGHSYASTFCEYRLIGGALAHCPKYNEYKRIK